MEAISTLFLGILFATAEGQWGSDTAPSSSLEFPDRSSVTTGDFCSLLQKETGVCVPIRQCRQDVSFSSHPPVCTYIKFLPIVCCPRDKIAGDNLTAPQPPPVMSSTPSSLTQLSSEFTPVGERSRRACDQYKEMLRFLTDDTVQNIDIQQPVEPKQLPHMGLVGFGKRSKIYWRCSTALVSPRYVIAPGHCVASRRHGAAKWVMLGIVDPYDSTLPSDAQVFEIEERVAHDGFKPPSLHDDLSLLRLDREARLGPHVRPACLSPVRATLGMAGTVAGWELINWIVAPGYSHLKHASLEVIPDEACVEAYKTQPRLPGGYNKDKLLCIGNNRERTSNCERDSGGPFHTQSEDKIFTIFAVPLFGNTVCERRNNTPVLCTDVAKYLPWIEGVVWPLKSSQ